MATANDVIPVLSTQELKGKRIKLINPSTSVAALDIAQTGEYRSVNLVSSATANYGMYLEGLAQTSGALAYFYGKNTSATPGAVVFIETTTDTTSCGLKVKHNGTAGHSAIMAESVTAVSAPLFLKPQAAAPASPVEGQIYYDSTTHHLFVRVAAGWTQLDN